ELVEEEKEQKNWKGIIIAVLVIILVCSCVVVAVIIVTPEEVIERTGEKLSIEELVKGAYHPYAVKPIWSKDGLSLLYKNQDDELVIFECDSNYSSIFLDNSPYRESVASDFLISPDRSFILFIHRRKK
ncbi:DPP10-like protein, partial [Mya arenaria]